VGMILDAAGKRLRRTAGFVSTLEVDDATGVATGVAPKLGTLDGPWFGAARQWRRLPIAAVKEDDPR